MALWRSFVVPAAVVAVTVGVLAPPAASQSPARSVVASDLPGLVDSSHLDGAAAVTGSVRTADGGRAGGVLVVLERWPSSAQLAQLRIGASLPLTPIAKAITSPSGSYTLRVASATASAARRAPINAQVVAYTAGGVTAHDLTLPEGRSVGSGTVGPQTADLGGRAALFAPAGTPMTVGRASSAPKDNPGSWVCDTTKVTSYGSRWAIVGSFFSTTTGVRATFTYSQGVTNSAGVGFSVSGGFGSFTNSGTSSVSTSATIGFPPRQTESTFFMTEFNYADFKTHCHWTGTDGPSPTTYYNVKATELTGGSTTEHPSSGPSANYCKPYEPNSYIDLVRTKAVTWSNGALVGGAIGTDLSFEDGYSTTASLYVRNEASSTRQFCGRDSDVTGSDPAIVLAKA